MAGDGTKWLSRKEASRFLDQIGCPTSVGRLANLAANSNALGGPSFLKIGHRTVRYHPDDLSRWAKSRTRHIA